MGRIKGLLVCGVIVLFTFLSYERAYSDISEKKIIKLYGWDKVTTSYLKEHISEIEKIPLDGLCVVVMPDKGIDDSQDGGHGNFLWFGNFPFTQDDFKKAVEDLKATEFQRFTDNFMHMAGRGPKNVDWFDSRWQTVIENAKVAGKICKDGKLKGITFDVENAGPFNYSTRPKKYNFMEYVAKTRKCGKEWMEALVSVYPDITVILTHGHWLAADQMESLGVNLEDTTYALLPSFIDGLLEGLGSKAMLVDGQENTYPLMCYQTYMNFRWKTENQDLKLTSVPELYKEKMKKAFGLWPGFPLVEGRWLGENPDKNHFSPERFEHALYNALNATDRYVWLWSDSNCWWQPSMPAQMNKKTYIIPQVYIEALAKAREPHNLNWASIPPDNGNYTNAKKESGYDDKGVFKDLWKDYELIMDISQAWWFKADPDNVLPELAEQLGSWTDYSYGWLDESAGGWEKIQIGDYWENQGYPYDGVAWYRVHFKLPEDCFDRRLFLIFGGIANQADVWVGGKGLGQSKQIGKDTTGKMFILPVKGTVVPGKDNVLIVRVYNPSGPGGIYGSVKVVAKKGEKMAKREGRQTILRLEFDENSGSTANDKSSYHNDGRIYNAEWVTGKSGSALRFDGVGSYVDCGNDLSLDAVENRVSYEVWFNPVEEVKHDIVYHILVAKDSMYKNGLYLNYSPSPNSIVFIQGNTNSYVAYPIPSYGKFYHIVGTYDGKVTSLYVNGERVGTLPNPMPVPISESPLLIGGGITDTGRFTKGIIDSVAIYNWALSDEEVRANFSGREEQK